MSITGPESQPFKVGYAVTDILTGQMLNQAILAAILHKERTGEGQFVETNMLNASLYSLAYVPASYLMGGVEYARLGNQHPNIAPYSGFKTKDQAWIILGVATEPQWKKLE